MFHDDRQRLRMLLDRLQELEQKQVPTHERAILEIARSSVRDAIRELVHRLHDRDYTRGAESYWS